MSAVAKPLHITVVSDVVCPWCYIGKRHLETAIAGFAAAHPDAPTPDLEWSAFQLNPTMPQSGMDRRTYVANKFGDNETAIMARMALAGKNAGIDFNFDAIQRQPNTLGLHAVIAAADTQGQQTAVVERLFQANFLEGVDLTDAPAIISLLTPLGLRPEVIADCLDPQGAAQANVASIDAHWRSLQVQGVPLFVFDRQWAVSGAQPPEALIDAMTHAMSQRAAS